MVVYIDDILIYSKDLKEHNNLVTEVLVQLLKERLAAEPEKYDFDVARIDFVGNVISPESVEILHAKIDSIAGQSDLRTVKDIQTFMRFANFYRRFIPNFRRITCSITDILKSEQKEFWIPNEFQEAFRQLKKAFTSVLISRHFNPDLPSSVETYVSDFALGAILSQSHEDHLYPVAYHSRKFQPTEVNYEVQDKEMLAIVDSLKHWSYYLEGTKHPFIVYTDNKNLECFLTTKSLNHRQTSRVELLANYDFTIVY